ncbi:prolipoprotein diacylglyceryl transferase [Parasphingopyxis marina]|uniref:Phosphatidylglycerol--prolipoprotein diacylglyceryl transferase n=1 Tax=Parasphingopyxis marina TaxID=2761622 RepID=A0A842HUF9_9SPHN|nr:prolipoprotein diacylglyceryl transferase [Parasphingopyxis marina]MBC2776706.1 prolipoprotein diacylglyceryl transferase [Parasphingopyxis marina]
MDFLVSTAAASIDYLRWSDLGLSPIALDLGFFELRWYSLAYIAGIVVGWWYLLKLIAKPGAPMARRHADDLVFYATLGILLGGRLGYVFFYKPMEYLQNPAEIIRVWDGGMSFHGGVIGVSLAILFMAWKNKLSWLRIHDYVACTIPFGLFFGRLANFVNGELWGRPGDVPWAIIFPRADEQARHPSQLYEAGLEGIGLFLLLWFLFWKTDARHQPGKLVGAFLMGYGLSRFVVEFFREPDDHLGLLWFNLSMGQLLTLPMLIGGAWLIATAKGRAGGVTPVPAEANAGN